MKPLILLIEDDAQIRRFLRAALDAEGYRLQESITAEEGLAQAASRQPDLILLDLGLPDRDGLEVIEKVREWGKIPILVLSARGQEKDKIAALDLGADDYVAKPFAIGELLARIRAALRRSDTREWRWLRGEIRPGRSRSRKACGARRWAGRPPHAQRI